VSFWWRHAGLVSLGLGRWNLHLFPAREHRQWGYVRSWYDGPIHFWGLGPLVLLAWTDR
jgi:hypothetical protein